jgi:hypothetical protein
LARVSLQLNTCTAPYLDSQANQMTVGQEA